MTLAEMVTAVMYNCGLDDRFDHEAAKRYLNEVQIELAMLSSEITNARVAHQGGVADFSLPEDCLVVKGLAWESPSGTRSTLVLADSVVPPTKTSGTPTKYMQKSGNTYTLIPTPNDSGYLVFGYVKRPQEMSGDNDVPSFPDTDNILVAYATWRCLLDVGDSVSEKWFTTYFNLRNQWMSFDTMRNPKRRFIEESDDWW